MKHLFCQAQIWRFRMPRQRRFVNPWWANAIIAHEFSVIFYGLLPTFHVFFPAFKTTLMALFARLPTPPFFKRMRTILLVNDALFGNDTGMSGPCPVVFPNKTISISKGAGFRPRDVTRPEQ